MSAAPSCSPLLKRIDGAGLLVFARFSLRAAGHLRILDDGSGRALLSLGIASLVLKIALRKSARRMRDGGNERSFEAAEHRGRFHRDTSMHRDPSMNTLNRKIR